MDGAEGQGLPAAAHLCTLQPLSPQDVNSSRSLSQLMGRSALQTPGDITELLPLSTHTAASPSPSADTAALSRPHFLYCYRASLQDCDRDGAKGKFGFDGEGCNRSKPTWPGPGLVKNRKGWRLPFP